LRISGGIGGGNLAAPLETTLLAPSESAAAAGAVSLAAATVAMGSIKLTLFSKFLSWQLSG
jgi:hypothetical protein